MSPTRYPAISTLLLLTFTVTPLLGQVQSTFDTDIQILERLAEERYAEGDLQRAADLYYEIATKQIDDRAQAKALFTAAWLLQLTGDRSRPLDLLTRSLRLDPEQPFDSSLYDRNFELLYRQALDIALRERRRAANEATHEGVAHLQAGRDTQARASLEEALVLDADNATALYNLALLDLRIGALPKALGDFERVVSLTYKDTGAEMSGLRARSLVGIGLIYQQQGRQQDAEQSFLEATRADPMEASAWKSLGLLQLNTKQYAAATTPLQRAAELLPADRAVIVALVEGLDKSGRTGQACLTLNGFLNQHPADAELWQQLAALEESRGNPEAAMEALESSITADQENHSGVGLVSAVRLATLHLTLGDYENALFRANQALGWNRSDPDAWTVLGETQLATKQLAQATASLSRAAELDPESATRQVVLGDALLSNNKISQAEAAYLRALTLDPNSAEAPAKLEQARSQMADERAIVAGKAKPRKPLPPKKIGLEFAGIDYKDLQLRGALVKQVKKKSPAARAGLRKGDLVLWIGDYAVVSDKDFMQFLKRNPPGRSLDIEFLRDGRIYDTELKLR